MNIQAFLVLAVLKELFPTIRKDIMASDFNGKELKDAQNNIILTYNFKQLRKKKKKQVLHHLSANTLVHVTNRYTLTGE